MPDKSSDKNSSNANDIQKSFLNTERGKTKSNAIEIPSISLPKGGGAINGIDEKFSVNAVNGTASFSIPLPFSAARGASPALTISYNSGNGNSIFGLGWSLSLASIKRKTDKELPRYFDATESDTYLFSEAEDLVPEFKKDNNGSFTIDTYGDYVFNEKDSPDGFFTIRSYKPRIEGLFARIERWTEKATGIIKWRVITKDNVTTLFGWTVNSVIVDPTDPLKRFEWLPEFVFDDKGNCCHYIYRKEDDKGFSPSLLHNRNRIKNGAITYTNRYLEKVLYGNKTPYIQFGNAFPLETDYLFQTVFDYGDYDTNPPWLKIKDWDFRTDSFSEYKPGFEIRTTRLVKRVLLFHFFNELPGGSALIRSTDFEYDTSSEKDFTFLQSITVCGYIKKADGSYTTKKLPALEFAYQKHEWNTVIKSIATDNLVHAPTGLDEQQYQFTDLFNEGLAGILTEQANGWYYKHNLGDGTFEQAKLVTPKPSFTGLGTKLQLVDLDADGGKQLASFNTAPRGYFELNDDNQWQGFSNFQSMPNIDIGDGNVRMMDLNGDGKPEVVVVEENMFTWYQSEGRAGFSNGHITTKKFDEEAGPNFVFADTQQTIFLADMSGNGMTDIVRIRNGEVCYWPNLGYGKFGSKIAMDNAPVFDHPESFDPRLLRLADIDGSGTTDIIYLGRDQFTCWMNLNGNSFSTSPFEINAFPEIHAETEITVTDLLGNGVACIVWSSRLEKDQQAPLQYIDLMKSKKPHIMVFYKNNLGKEVSLEYTPSTKFYVEDKKAGMPWITKLHFPIHCISKTETVDKISGWRFVSSYKYHHGYYDHAEREFRGFGMVEQTDAEYFENWVKGNATNIVDKELHQEPVVSKTWFHTGASLRKEKILHQFKTEYWYEILNGRGFSVVHNEVLLPDARIVPAKGIPTTVIDNLSNEEWQQALRACKSMPLRAEIFAHDAPAIDPSPDAIKKQLTPYSVATHNCVIELVQPKGKNRHAVFIVKESESITYNYERNTEDPRIAHNLNIALDEYGNVLESATVVYPRFQPVTDLPIETQQEQSKTVVIYSQNQFTNDVLGDVVHRLRLAAETKTFELKGVAKTGVFYTIADFDNILTVADEVPYQNTDSSPTPGIAQKRLIEHVRTNYYKNDLSGMAALHQLESLALPFESYQLAYTASLVTDIYGNKVNDQLLTEGRFTHSEGDANWWVRSGTTQFITGTETAIDARQRFYKPVEFTDPYGSKTRVRYYSDYFLFVEETEDELGNRSRVDLFNFRILSPQRMRDSNDNLSEVITDELGLVKAMAVMGKGNEADDLNGLTEFTEAAESDLINTFFNSPDSVQLTTTGKNLLQHASSRFVYDFNVYKNTGKPAVTASIVREEHFVKNNDSPVQLSFEYSNGLGSVAMKKAQAEPGLAKKVTIDPDNTYTITEVDTAATTPQHLRWIGNGRTILNNKGNPVKEYEPYFSVSHQYEDLKELVETGVTPIMYYDALSRLIKTELPDGTFSRVEFDSWKQAVYDVNDTILTSAWYLNRTNHLIDAQLIAEGKDPAREKTAADNAAKHANTPNMLHFDTLGRPVLSINQNRNIITDADEFYRTKVKLDAEGNLCSVTDARELPENNNKGNTVVQYKYDMLGNLAYQHSMDAGQRWLLANSLGKPLRTWDERDHEFQYFYDALHRPLLSKVIGGDGSVPLDNIFDRIIYGESEPDPEAYNLRGQIRRQYDTGGLIDMPVYDFKGKPLATTRTLLINYKAVPNWIDANLENDLENNNFTFNTETDALGRIIQQTAPDGSIIISSYNEGGLLNGKSVTQANPALTTVYIKDIDYNEKGQRNKITYGNDVTTRFYYDKETFRLKRLESKRQNNDPLQDWHYTYDPAGNITHIEDTNIPVNFFNNQKISGVSEYTYDALYRLISATGRENNAALSFDNEDNWRDAPFLQQLNPGDPMTMRNYTQSFQYDPTGNILQMHHQAIGNNWTRDYSYAATNNRLISTAVGSQLYQYPHHAQHGFITALSHLEEMHWNFKEELIATIRQRRTDGGTAETTWYQYDGKGQRIRKITENQAAPGSTSTKKEERIYLAGYELYKKHSGTDAGLERVSQSLMDEAHRFVMIETRNDVDDGTEKQLVRYQLSNHLGSTALELNENGEVISYEEYHPYGTTAYFAKNATIKAAAKRYRFTGMERDEETGLEYHSARYYLPWLGRWLNADPIGIEDGLNLYRYVSGNPVRLHDPGGTDEKPYPGSKNSPTPYNVRSNPDKMFAENKHALSNWQKAQAIILENIYEQGSLKANIAAFEAHIDEKDPDGPQKIGKRWNYKSQKGWARYVAFRIQQQFYRLESKSPTWNYSSDQIKNMAKGMAPDPLQQFEHIDPLAKNPKNAFNAKSVYLTEGGPKGAIPKESAHGKVTFGELGKRLRAFIERTACYNTPNGEPPPPKPVPAPPPVAKPTPPPIDTPEPAPASGSKPNVKPPGGGVVGKFNTGMGTVLSVLSMISMAKDFYRTVTGTDDGAVYMTQVPFGEKWIPDPQKYFRIHMAEYGYDIPALEGKTIELEGKVYLIQNGLPVEVISQ
jgi:RHS repeat-associated protein